MTFHKCNCHYVPPHVLGNMAKKGDPAVRQAARTSVQQAKLSRGRRGGKAPEVPEMLTGIAAATAPAPGTAAREVYDCEHEWRLRVKLARGEGDPEYGDDDVDTVYGFAETVRGYFAELGRDSIDNAGMNIRLNVHVGVNYMNAFWDGDEMAFGDGDGQIFTSFAQSLDVTAHEAFQVAEFGLLGLAVRPDHLDQRDQVDQVDVWASDPEPA